MRWKRHKTGWYFADFFVVDFAVFSYKIKHQSWEQKRTLSRYEKKLLATQWDDSLMATTQQHLGINVFLSSSGQIYI